MEMDPKRAGFALDRLDRIGDHLERNYIGPGKIAGCQVTVSRRGYTAYFKSFGQMDRERGRAMQDDTIFRIYSMSKPITSVALMTLYERGYFQLNDPVSKVFPQWKNHKVWQRGADGKDEYVEPATPMTFRHVLSHTGGLTYGDSLTAVGGVAGKHPVDQAYRDAGVRGGGNETLSEFVGKLANVPLRYQPGERWMYSLSTDVCGALVEAISGKRFDKYLKDEVFDPLGMKDTSFFVAPDKASRFAACYRRAADKSLKLLDDPTTSSFLSEPTFFGGGGGLTSTSADYLRFCEMLRRGGELDGQRILGPRTLEMMHMNHLKDGKDLTQMAIGGFSETANEGVGFGLGFASTLGQTKTGTLGAGDYYWGGAASTIFWIDPKEDMAVVFMTQLMPSATFNFRGQLKSIIYSAIVD
jgi:CubicO group peptidase (beta-lactamase class C family)